MSDYHSDIYDDENDRTKNQERFVELTKNVIQIIHPLLKPMIQTPKQAEIDYHTNPHFHLVCRSIVQFIMTEKPDAEAQLLQTIEVENLIRNTKFLINDSQKEEP